MGDESTEGEIARLRERLLIAPGDTDAMLDLAALLESVGDLPGAIDLCQRALRVDPYRAEFAARLGGLWSVLGDGERARNWFERALAIDPDCGDAAQWLAALVEADAITPAYIRALFDQYAERFDAELTGALHYRAPALVAAALDRSGIGEASADILDLGCGTGLSGAALKPFARRLDGVDLSPRMMAKARQRAIYDSLEVVEARAFLDRSDRTWNAIVAVDMLNYVGELGPVLAAAAACLAPGGLVAGTIEKRDEGGVGLTEKRRYAHGEDYLRDAADRVGLIPLEISGAVLRTEGGAPVSGLVFVLRRR